MIKIADDSFKELISLRAEETSNPYNVRIASLYKAYAKTTLCEFWVQTRNYAPVSFLAKAGGSMTLELSCSSDLEEIEQFLPAVAFSTVLCDSRYQMNLQNTVSRGGAVMRLEKAVTLPIKPEITIAAPDLRELHKLLLRCGDEKFKPPPFEDFYPDLSHKLRHGCAAAAGVMKDGRLIACALAVFKFNNSAVIGSVAADPLYRRRGYASAAVNGLIDLLNEAKTENIFLHRLHRKNEDFYKKLGFENIGQWSEFA